MTVYKIQMFTFVGFALLGLVLYLCPSVRESEAVLLLVVVVIQTIFTVFGFILAAFEWAVSIFGLPNVIIGFFIFLVILGAVSGGSSDYSSGERSTTASRPYTGSPSYDVQLMSEQRKERPIDP